jgi:hypothetical protein
MSNPVAGDEMADFSVAVIRGTNIPLVVLVKSNTDVAAGDEVPMPTWACMLTVVIRKNANSKCLTCFIFVMVYNWVVIVSLFFVK